MSEDRLPDAQQETTSWWRRLRRTTRDGRYLPFIDGIRFLSIVLVLLYHVGGFERTEGVDLATRVFRGVQGNGWFGVQLFFALSGFILYWPFARAARDGRTLALGRYYVRRVARIEPPFLIATTGMFVAWLVLGREGVDWATFGRTIVYLETLFGPGTGNPINPVIWSLEVEVQFYLLAPLLFVQLGRVRNDRFRHGLLWLGVAGAAAVYLLNAPVRPPLHATLLAQFGYFLVGIAAADLWVYTDREEQRRSWFEDLRALAGVALLAWSLANGAKWNRIGVSAASHEFLRCVGVYLLLVGVMRGRLTNAALSLPSITAIGGMCYTIYLYHFWLMRGLQGQVNRVAGDGILAACLLALVAILCSIPLYLAFERPFMRAGWYSRLLGRRGSERSGDQSSSSR